MNSKDVTAAIARFPKEYKEMREAKEAYFEERGKRIKSKKSY